MEKFKNAENEDIKGVALGGAPSKFLVSRRPGGHTAVPGLCKSDRALTS